MIMVYKGIDSRGYFLAFGVLLSLAWFMGSCSSPPQGDEARLQDLRESLSEKMEEVRLLEEEITAFSLSSSGRTYDALVTVYGVHPRSFKHELEIRGKVQSERNIVLAAETQGRVRRIYVKEGDRVSSGMVLVRLDDDVLQNNLAEIENNLSLAQLRYERQSNLWEKQVGTEFQYLTAKNQYEGLKRRKATLLSQLSYTLIRAPYGGLIEDIFVREGEFLGPSTQVIRLFDPSVLHAEAEIPDIYAKRLDKGDKVRIHVLSSGEDIFSALSHVGSVVDNENRSLLIRSALSPNSGLLPNQVLTLWIEDYVQDSTLVLPLTTILKDQVGDYVFRLLEEGDGFRSEKVYVRVGKTYRGEGEILEGLEAGDNVVEEGARNIQEGMYLGVSDKSAILGSQ